MTTQPEQRRQPIRHVVVLMMENRSFDHLLGHLDQGFIPAVDPERDSNPRDPGDPRSERVPVFWQERFDDVPADPGHGFGDVMMQLTGRAGPWRSPYSLSNEGFVWNFARRTPHAEKIMGCFPAACVPVMSTLAQSFAVCTRWHCSLPSETWPNRLFVHAGSSLGTTRGFFKHHFRQRLREFRAKNIFTLLDEHRLDSRVYAGDVPQTLTFGDEIAGRWRSYDDFRIAVKNDRLPEYAFIEPRHFLRGNSQHWPQDIRAGEALMADVYTTLRDHPGVWQKTVLIITYDEHGGFYDRVGPPEVDATGDTAEDDFRFDLLGPRVPSLVISPYVEAGTVDYQYRDEDGSWRPRIYDLTSVTATVREIFGIQTPLSNREKKSHTLTHLLSRLDAREEDDTPDLSAHAEADESVEALEEAMPPDDLQRQLLEMIEELDPETPDGTSKTLETRQAAQVVVDDFIRRRRPEAPSD